jgi:hypothetical protein
MFSLQRILLLFFFSLFLSEFACGQSREEISASDRPIRVEIPVKTTDETYRVIPCNHNGVVLFFKSVETIGDSLTKWYFSMYDKDLQRSWVRSIPVASTMMFHESVFENDTLSMLFVKRGKEKEKKNRFNFFILHLALKSGTFTGNTGNLPDGAEDIDFKLFHQIAFLCYNVKNESAQLQVLQLENGKSSTFPWSYGKVSRVTGFKVDSVSLRIRASLSQVSSTKTRSENFLVSMDLNGKILADIPIQIASSNRYLYGLDFIPVDNDSWFLYGSYGTTPPKNNMKNKRIAESSGFFTGKFVNGQPCDLTFVNLLELNNSKDLLGEKDIIALKKKALKKNRNLSEYSLDYPLLLHKIFRHKDQFILLSETFAPQYHSESFTDFDFYGRPYVNTYDVFDGYRYNNGIITAFDKEGKLVWDNTMEIRNVLTYELTPKITAFFTPGDEVVLAYLSEGKIASKIIKGNQVVEKLDFSNLEMSNSEDKLLVESKSGMLPWYDQFFLCYGYQEIKNINSTENKKRLVFYFSKIAFN